MMSINTEKLAYWFFRLNGCLTIENFVVHPNTEGSQLTDADILGLRFPHRAELSPNTMLDHHALLDHGGKPLLVIAEVKLKECKLNGPWTMAQNENMHRVLRAIGVLPESKIEQAATTLYRKEMYETDECRVRLFIIGDKINTEYPSTVMQITWNEVLGFVHERFNAYRGVKGHHPQWEGTAKSLFRLATKNDLASFTQQVRKELNDGNRNWLEERKPASDETL